ncbi:MAG: RNA polymerase sigma factor FliA [Gammaproteobacteria bacterium]|nr:MAG: RNA polymerase sigma factor FliA [Gammaproteobacteria bacterium]
MYAAMGRDTGEVVVEQHMDLVRRLAHHLMGRLPASVQLDDLIQAGVVGLLEAARHFDDSHGASFETYAGIRIRGAMLDEVRRQDWSPRSAHRASREISEAVRRVEGRTGREASAAEIARELGVELEAYHGMLRKVAEGRVFSLEDMFGADQSADEMLSGKSDDPARECVRRNFSDAAAEAIAKLPEREQLVLSLYYDQELNLKEIGEVLGVSESRVCQIHGQVLVRLRARLTDWTFDEVTA